MEKFPATLRPECEDEGWFEGVSEETEKEEKKYIKEYLLLGWRFIETLVIYIPLLSFAFSFIIRFLRF